MQDFPLHNIVTIIEKEGIFMLKHYDLQGFEQDLNSGKVMLVDFWANWCMPCRMLGPVIEKLAGDYEGKAEIGRVDVDEQGELAMRYGVMSIPTVILFKDGQEVTRLVGVQPGVQPEEYFVKLLSEHV